MAKKEKEAPPAPDVKEAPKPELKVEAPKAPKPPKPLEIGDPIYVCARADAYEPFQHIRLIQGQRTLVKYTPWIRSQINGRLLQQVD